ncbi:hypothetical protein [Sorangium sp. So ce204]|uniref:hypothetical protein n=1 Tax=Sorangium sp. So ce204 TaxID=3133288 RepID=UPI003F614BEF
MEFDVSVKTSQLIEVLMLLAMSPEGQISALPPFVDASDELALLFGEQCDALDDDDLKRGLGNAGATLVEEIKKIFEIMMGRPELYSLSALQERQEWKRVRELSSEALMSAGIPLRAPVLNWVTYVPGG